VRGDGLEYAQGPEGQPSIGRWHVKRSLMHCQVSRLLRALFRCNLQLKNQGVHIMKEFHLIARLAQALLAIGMTVITGLFIFA
jgi:hypothetical protein